MLINPPKLKVFRVTNFCHYDIHENHSLNQKIVKVFQETYRYISVTF
jgi:hypothetical protein